MRFESSITKLSKVMANFKDLCRQADRQTGKKLNALNLLMYGNQINSSSTEKKKTLLLLENSDSFSVIVLAITRKLNPEY